MRVYKYFLIVNRKVLKTSIYYVPVKMFSILLLIILFGCLDSVSVKALSQRPRKIMFSVKMLVTQSNPTLCNSIYWIEACQAFLSMEFSRQDYRGGLPCPPPGDLPDPGIELKSPPLQADSLLSESPGKPIP